MSKKMAVETDTGDTQIIEDNRPVRICEHLWPDMNPPNCHRCGKLCVKGNMGSWMCDCTSTPFDLTFTRDK